VNRHSTEARSDASRPSTAHFLIAIIAAAATAVVVILFGLVVAKGHSFTAAETHLLVGIATSRSMPLVDVSLALNWLFSPPIAVIIGVIAAAVVLVVTRRWSATVHFILLVVGTWLSSEVVKVIVHRPRPNASLADTLVPNPDPDSYPSGHVCFAVGLGFAIVMLIARSRVRVIIEVVAVLLALVTAATRVYLGIHYPADAIASLVFAAAAFVAIEAIWRRYSGRVFRITA
jgi:undecaprenyl-diphosphatase